MLPAAPIPFADPAALVAVTSGANDILVIFVWFTVAAVLGLGGYYIVVAVRRWVQREESIGTFTIQDLRDMRARGQINDQEFAAMRSALLAQLDLHDTGDAGQLWGPSEPPHEEPPHGADEAPPETDAAPPPES